MGVKDLWNIISTLSERKPLFEIHGKTVAIDLSGWVVDSQSVSENAAQPKIYLRNLFFRTAYLLMRDISPVFVLEGKAPELKHKEIARRNDIRRGVEKKTISTNGGRSRFNRILKECQTMLELMGLKCIKGVGEAEAMCAYLNADGMVDGCISQDSDCFLYGAKTVYRNFSISTQGGNQGGTGGSIDEYSMEKIERVFKIDRKKMIVLALLCGCDYEEGIHGVGKEAALKLFKLAEDEDILERIKSWRTDPKFVRMESKLQDPNICTSCGHGGKVRLHAKSGCADCGTVLKCAESYKEERSLISNEIALRKKALAIEDFPNQDLIDEFLVRREKMPSHLDLQWRQPKIVEFVNFMERHVCWDPDYAFAKIFPLTTHWQLRHIAYIPDQDRLLMKGIMIPERIKKIRNVKGVAGYEIVWLDKDGLLEGLTLAKTSDEENDSDTNDKGKSTDDLVSIEPQDAVRKCYPELVEEFESARLAKKKKPAKPRKKKAPLSELNNLQSETSGPKKKCAVRRPRKKAVEAGNKRINEFFQPESSPTLEESFEAMTIAAKRSKPQESTKYPMPIASGTPKRGPQFDKVLATVSAFSPMNDTIGKMFDALTPDDFASEMENESINMSEIIEQMCSKKTSRPLFDGHTICPSLPNEHKYKIDSVTTFENNEVLEDDADEAGGVAALDMSDEFDAIYVPLNERVKKMRDS